MQSYTSHSHQNFSSSSNFLGYGILFNSPTPLAPAVGSLRSPPAGAVRRAQSLCHVYYPSFVLSLNLSSVFKFNLSRAKQSLPKISTKFLSVCPSVRPSVRPSVCPENQTLFRWRNFFGGNRKTHHNKHDTMIAPAGGERSEPTAGARGVGELKRIPSRRS